MRLKTLGLLGLISLLYLVLHLVRLTDMPVFADEAIYIRWAQLIMDDPQRYLFFAMNDGKTPLFIWMLVPFQYIFSNPLFAARLVSVLIGLVQVWTMGLILKAIKVDQKIIYIGMLLTAIMPFWYMHHRLAIMDGLLTLGISIAFLGIIKLMDIAGGQLDGKPLRSISTYRKLLTGYWRDKIALAAIGLTAAGVGLALWSKLPAVIAFPIFYLPIVFRPENSWHQRLEHAIRVTVALLLGVGIFLLLRLNPAFGQLFSRGGDFLYPVSEVLFQGLWRETIIGFPNYFNYFIQYLGLSFFLLIAVGLFTPRHRSRTHLMFWSAILFILPIALLGKVVYPRYLFPAALFFTLAGASALDGIYKSWIIDGRNKKSSGTKSVFAMSMVLALLLANIITSSINFIQVHIDNPDNTPFVSADREQYVTQWSSGHGIAETADAILVASKTSTLAIATEGYFGTLPDGLLMYLHGQDVSNIYLEGIGQPVSSLPTEFVERAQNFDQTWLVVNSHRLRAELPSDWLITEYCRPFAAPCLQIWDVTPLVKSYIK